MGTLFIGTFALALFLLGTAGKKKKKQNGGAPPRAPGRRRPDGWERGPSPADTDSPTEADEAAAAQLQEINAIVQAAQVNPTPAKLYAAADQLRAIGQSAVFPEVADIAFQAADNLAAQAVQLEAQQGTYDPNQWELSE